MPAFDVLIAGAGPAGSAAALALALSAPALRVALVDRPQERRAPAVEVLSPLVHPVLRQLGLWDAFRSGGHAPAYRSHSAWGGPGLDSDETLTMARGPAWCVDRPRFDRWLAEQAGRGATRIVGRVVGLHREAGAWSVDCGGAGRYGARLAIDATGRACALARCGGRRAVPLDAMVAAQRQGLDGNAGPPELIVEAFPDGWWYTVALPDGRRIAACMTDADIARRLELATLGGWLAALDATRFVAPVVGRAAFEGPPRLAPAAGRRLAEAARPGLLSVGDAAIACDPISGQGVVKAMRSGIFAAYAAGDSLLRDDPAGLDRFGGWSAREALSYEAALSRHYGAQARWAEHPFWRRRRTTDERPVMAARGMTEDEPR